MNCEYCGGPPVAGRAHVLMDCVSFLKLQVEHWKDNATNVNAVLTKTVEKLAVADLQRDEILKEFKFRQGLATLWISQLRQALGEAMDVLASDPDHDVALQARLELTRRAVDCTEKRVVPVPNCPECGCAHAPKEQPFCSR